MKKLLSFLFLALIIPIIFVMPGIADEANPVPREALEKERKITENISEQVEKQIPLVKDPKREGKLAEIAARLKPHMKRNLNYEVRIIERSDPHSFSLPGGLTYITTGMLEFLRSDDETAAVLAREFSHCDRSHWLIQSSRNDKIDLSTVAEAAAATQSGKVAGSMVKTYLNRAVINFYDIDLEKETDLITLELLPKAGYDGAALLTFIERMRIERMKQLYVRGIDIRYRSGFKPLETVLDTMRFIKPKEGNRKETDPVRTDMVEANTDMEERMRSVISYFNEHQINIRRKKALNVLKTRISNKSGEITLAIDATEVIKSVGNEGSVEKYEGIKRKIDSYLELETALYDIQVQQIADSRVLLIEGRSIVDQRDLPGGKADLGRVRDRIVKALRDARRENFLTDYYE